MNQQAARQHGANRRDSCGNNPTVLVVSAAALLLLLYSLGSYTSTHGLTHNGRMRTAITAGGGLGQQLQAELSRGAAGQLQQHILALSNISSLSTAQLPLLLQGTNLSSIATADVLDSAAAKGLGWQQHWQLVQLHQQLLCTSGLTAVHNPPNSVPVKLGNCSVFVYAAHDFVSQELAGPRHSYEEKEVAAVLWAMQQQQQAAGAAPRVKQQPLFVDAGANVGSFLFSVADAGYRVAAFEGMPSNIALLRHSLCANPHLRNRVGLFGTGLGAEADTCYVVSDHINVGDGHTVCGEEQVRKRTDNTGYTIRGKTSVRRLDSILSEDIQVLKLDVEGFELQVLQGADSLLTKHRVNYILTACTFGGAPRQRQMLQLLDQWGYYISLDGFKGPWLDPAAVANGSSKLPWNNIFCARKDLQHATPAR
ncbi:hypothetical protein OEZ85_000010 [Tetradesmus obliquus]|uniref:Methyltransferase FkbM domain-containing protein n=1 Tax=Tetradesmus obliquus TaxID=3088 RepID=A0ABY8UUL4_TETOB|nr:hypothetical protein OEZ85_000010 [Tetradesmus obliquus]